MSDLARLALLAAGCLAAASLLLPITYTALRRLGVIDAPNHRSSHERDTIRGGGVACALAVALTSLVASGVGLPVPWAAVAGSLFMASVGFVDDARGVPPVPRLALQVLTGLALGTVLGGPWLALAGALAVPILVNAVNFMDGINGITALTVIAWAAVVITASSGALTGPTFLASVALGSALAFLPWNVPRARMFLGDSGSYLFGTLMAAALLESGSSGISPWIVVAPLGVYLADTGLALARRAARGERLLTPHREHIYQRMVQVNGLAHLCVAALAATLALVVGLSVAFLNAVYAVLVSVALLAMYSLAPSLAGKSDMAR